MSLLAYKNRNFFERVAFALSDKEKLKSPLLVKSAFDDEQKLKQMEQELKATEDPATLKELEKLKRIIELGIHGEQSVLFELQNAFLPIHILHDLRIAHNNLKAQLDFVVITRKFILVIEVKNYYGDIEVTEKDEFVRIVRQNKFFKEGFYSPIRQVQRQVNVFENLLKDKQVIDKMPVKYVVVFSNKRTIINTKKASSEVRDKILRADQLVNYLKNELKKDSPTHLLDKRMEEISDYIKAQHQSEPFNEIDAVEEKLIAETISNEEQESKLQAPEVAATVETTDTDKLHEALRVFRTQQAAKKNAKPFYIFSNKTLDELVTQQPSSREELKKIHGFGDVKIQEFGNELIEVIRGYR